MGIFSGLFKKKAPPLPPGAGIGKSDYTTAKGHVPIVPSTGKGTGIDGWSPHLATTLPTLKNQDDLLIHFDLEKPADPGHPSPFWQKRNAYRIKSGEQFEHWQTGGQGNGLDSWQEKTGTYQPTIDPKLHPVLPSRPTAYQSPSSFRFFAPMRSGRGDTPHLNGFHFSMASNRRSYPIRGMRPAMQFRNTFRLEPPPRDAQSMDVPSESPSVPGNTYVTPSANRAPSGSRGSYRL